jgi:hypothetical protein
VPVVEKVETEDREIERKRDGTGNRFPLVF